MAIADFVKGRMAIPKNAEGKRCYACQDLRRAGNSDKILQTEHDRCHGWYHCNGCCGSCPIADQRALTVTMTTPTRISENRMTLRSH